jgi:hypothetical protein
LNVLEPPRAPEAANVALDASWIEDFTGARRQLHGTPRTRNLQAMNHRIVGRPGCRLQKETEKKDAT